MIIPYGPPRVFLVSERIADCGCPEETWVVDWLDVTMHFEDEGDGPHADVFVDAGDWDVENRHAGDRTTARNDAIAFILSWPACCG